MRYFRTLTFSLIFHLALGLLLNWLYPPTHTPFKQASFVELLEKPALPDRPHQPPHDMKHFVRSVDVPDTLIAEKKKEARFASESDRSVIEETRARNTDLTVNRSSQVIPAPQSKPAREKAAAKMARLDLRPRSALERIREDNRNKNSNGDILVATEKVEKDGREPGPRRSQMFPSIGVQPGVSSFGESTPDDIKFGDMTALNTDRHLFYTFYARMEEKIRYRWITYARAAMYSLPIDLKKATGKDVWETRMEVLLDREGHYLRSILHESSGVKSLDTAPAQALRDANQFPNPPNEMVKADGMIHIYYTFTVNGGPGSVADRN